MTERPLDLDAGRLVANARAYRHDPHLDPIADAMDRGDTEAWSRLHPLLQERADDYRHFRRYYREAVAAGVIDDDRGPDPAA